MRDDQQRSPDVSVIIPAYRASRDIANALASVFAQTFANFEVIVVDDGSPDRDELAVAIAPYRSRIRYIEQSNQGAGAARNAAIRIAHGRYLAFLDADDRWEPDFLRGQVWYLEANPNVTVVYCDAMRSGETALAGRRYMEAAPSKGVTLISLIAQRCNIILSTVVARREAIVGAGLFDESLRRGQEFELWLRLVLGGARIEYRNARPGRTSGSLDRPLWRSGHRDPARDRRPRSIRARAHHARAWAHCFADPDDDVD